MSVCSVRHKSNKKMRNSKRHIITFSAGGDPVILPRKFSFHGGVSRDILFAEKVVMCCRCKSRCMLGKNCLLVSPTPEQSDMSYNQQNETSRASKTPQKAVHSAKNQPSAESQQELSSTEDKPDGDDSLTDGSGEDSGSGSTSEPRDEDDSELVSSVPETPLQKIVTSTSQTKPLI